MRHLALCLAGLALAASSPSAAAEPASDLQRYIELQSLYSRGFSCTRAVRRFGPMHPALWRLNEQWGEALVRLRSALARRDGEERVAAAERALEQSDEESEVHFSGPCSLSAADRARAAFSHRLRNLERRLGLPPTRRGRD